MIAGRSHRLSLTTHLPRSPDAVNSARRLVDRHTTSLAFARRRDAALMVSELVINAVLHGVGAITLRIDVESDAVRVEVADERDVVGAPTSQPGAHGDWGLHVVEQLADDWGVLDGNTRVWFRLGRPGPPR